MNEKLAVILEKMKEAAENSDYEDAHGDADDLLVSALITIAAYDKDIAGVIGEIISAYAQVGKWYS